MVFQPPEKQEPAKRQVFSGASKVGDLLPGGAEILTRVEFDHLGEKMEEVVTVHQNTGVRTMWWAKAPFDEMTVGGSPSKLVSQSYFFATGESQEAKEGKVRAELAQFFSGKAKQPVEPMKD